jgi:hypothetical protein
MDVMNSLYSFVVCVIKIIISAFLIYTLNDATQHFPSLPSGLVGGVIPIALKWISEEEL